MDNCLIIDCVLYNGERIVSLRLSYLYEHVNYIYITESRYSFTGIKKDKLYFEQHADIFAPYMDKIIFLEITEFPPTSSAWDREKYQRNYAQSFIRERFDSRRYIILCCDVDEIPRKELVEILPEKYSQLDTPCHLEMKLYYYNFNWIVPQIWDHQFIVNDVGFKSREIDNIRTGQKMMTIHKAGWHFSYFASCADIRTKLESFSHTEFDDEKFKSIENIKNSIKNGADLFHRDMPLVAATENDYKDLPEKWGILRNILTEIQ
jgi:beta-1,4-mannosyl-glycoprotein beta-1,4-N-acetylglucosaminyltransferase